MIHWRQRNADDPSQSQFVIAAPDSRRRLKLLWVWTRRAFLSPVSQPPSERKQHGGEDARHRPFEKKRPGLDPDMDISVLDDHLARHPAENCAANPDNPPEAVHQLGKEAGA